MGGASYSLSCRCNLVRLQFKLYSILYCSLGCNLELSCGRPSCSPNSYRLLIATRISILVKIVIYISSFLLSSPTPLSKLSQPSPSVLLSSPATFRRLIPITFTLDFIIAGLTYSFPFLTSSIFLSLSLSLCSLHHHVMERCFQMRSSSPRPLAAALRPWCDEADVQETDAA